MEKMEKMEEINRIIKTLARTLHIYMNIDKYIDKEKDIVDEYSLDMPTKELGSVIIYEYEKETKDEIFVYQSTEDGTYEHLNYVHREDSPAVFGIQKLGTGMEIYVENRMDQRVVILEIRLPGQLTDLKDIAEYVKNVLDKGRLYVV